MKITMSKKQWENLKKTAQGDGSADSQNEMFPKNVRFPKGITTKDDPKISPENKKIIDQIDSLFAVKEIGRISDKVYVEFKGKEYGALYANDLSALQSIITGSIGLFAKESGVFVIYLKNS